VILQHINRFTAFHLPNYNIGYLPLLVAAGAIGILGTFVNYRNKYSDCQVTATNKD
jgi:hypothetical protein